MNHVEISPDVRMPQLGFGVWQVSDDQAADVVRTAIHSGYRSVDTAAIYRNERGTGQGICGLNRDELFITTKLWNDRHGDAEAALAESLAKLGLDYVDLYLIHWPGLADGRYVRAWRSLIALRDAGLTRAIGVSNFQPRHLQRIMDVTGVAPAVNQIELHPWMQQQALRDFHHQHGIATEAWSPIGQGGDLLRDPVIGRIATAKGKTPAQIVLRWHIQLGNIAIPKSATPLRIRENFDVFGFDLDETDMAALAGLNRDQRLGPNPDAFG
jgi:diketogulonate reductase-like aldo/keto reductase